LPSFRFLPPGLKGIPSQVAADTAERAAAAVAPPDILSKKIISAAREFNIEGYIIEKIDGYEEGKLEGIISELDGGELRLIELWGGALGFFLGVIQSIVLVLV
jgi:uncharacterized membrane protein YheB (UPF0754 family)